MKALVPNESSHTSGYIDLIYLSECRRKCCIYRIHTILIQTHPADTAILTGHFSPDLRAFAEGHVMIERRKNVRSIGSEQHSEVHRYLPIDMQGR